MTQAERFTIAGALGAAALFLALVPPIAQSESYHRFADCRTILGIPNFWNVVSNLAFAVVGYLGLRDLRGSVNRVMFTGVLLTCLGSGYYHLLPNDARLLWDRLPMTLVFMSFLTSVLFEDQRSRFANALLITLLTMGASSVVWWSATGDLRFYVLVQFVPMLILLTKHRSAGGRGTLLAVLGLYAAAKIAELFDQRVYSLLPISGHTCKHVMAALAAYSIYRWEMRRETELRGQVYFSADGIVTARASY